MKLKIKSQLLNNIISQLKKLWPNLVTGFFFLYIVGFSFYQISLLTDWGTKWRKKLPLYFSLTDMFTGYTNIISSYAVIGYDQAGKIYDLNLDQYFQLKVKGNAPRYAYPRLVNSQDFQRQLVLFVTQRWQDSHQPITLNRVELIRYDYILPADFRLADVPISQTQPKKIIPVFSLNL